MLAEGYDFVAVPPLDQIVSADSEIYVELSPSEAAKPERRWVRAELLVQLLPDPPAEPA